MTNGPRFGREPLYADYQTCESFGSGHVRPRRGLKRRAVDVVPVAEVYLLGDLASLGRVLRVDFDDLPDLGEDLVLHGDPFFRQNNDE